MIIIDYDNYRVLLRFFWKKGAKAAAAAREICQVEGPGTISTRAAQKWFKRVVSPWLHRGIEQLSERWRRTIDHNGLYWED